MASKERLIMKGFNFEDSVDDDDEGVDMEGESKGAGEQDIEVDMASA